MVDYSKQLADEFDRLINKERPNDKQKLRRWLLDCEIVVRFEIISDLSKPSGKRVAGIHSAAFLFAAADHVSRLGNPELGSRVRPNELYRSLDVDLFLSRIGECERWADSCDDIYIDLERMTVTVDGQTIPVKSEQALRWLKVLISFPNQWVSADQAGKSDDLLAGLTKTHRLLEKLPPQIAERIESQPGLGSKYVPRSHLA